MKINQEAWQLGSEYGWEDGYNDVPPKTEFKFPTNWSETEKEFFRDGYNKGYDQGAKDC